jgi:hypothetical protein
VINVIFSMDGPELEDARAFRAFGQWVLLNERNGRLLFDAVCAEHAIEMVRTHLDRLGRAPVIIAAWRKDGSPVDTYPFSLEAWLDVAPNEIGGDGELIRPQAFREVYGWAGWGAKR